MSNPTSEKAIQVASKLNKKIKNRSIQASTHRAEAATTQVNKEMRREASETQQSNARNIAVRIYKALRILQCNDPELLLKFHAKVGEYKAAHPRHSRRNAGYYEDAFESMLAQSEDLRLHQEHAEDATTKHQEEGQSMAMPDGFMTHLAVALDQLAGNKPKALITFQKAIERQTFSVERSCLLGIQSLLTAYTYGYVIETRVTSNKLPCQTCRW
jgi:hypothetical protein